MGLDKLGFKREAEGALKPFGRASPLTVPVAAPGTPPGWSWVTLGDPWLDPKLVRRLVLVIAFVLLVLRAPYE